MKRSHNDILPIDLDIDASGWKLRRTPLAYAREQLAPDPPAWKSASTCKLSIWLFERGSSSGQMNANPIGISRENAIQPYPFS